MYYFKKDLAKENSNIDEGYWEITAFFLQPACTLCFCSIHVPDMKFWTIAYTCHKSISVSAFSLCFDSEKALMVMMILRQVHKKNPCILFKSAIDSLNIYSTLLQRQSFHFWRCFPKNKPCVNVKKKTKNETIGISHVLTVYGLGLDVCP